MKKFNYKHILSFLLILLFGYYYQRNPDVFSSLKFYPTWILVVAGLIQVGFLITNGLFYKEIFSIYKVKINYLESFELSVLSTLGNYFLPLRGGAVIRAKYMKDNHNLSYTDFITTLYAMYVISFLAMSVIGIISLAIFIYKDNSSLSLQSIILLIVFAGMIEVCLAIISNKINFNRVIDSLSRISNNKAYLGILTKVKKIQDGWKILSSHPNVQRKLILLTFVNILIKAILFYLLLVVINSNLHILSVLIYNSISSFGMLISVTPGSLGIQESLLLFNSEVLKLDHTMILTASLVNRGTIFLTLLLVYVGMQFKRLFRIFISPK